MNVEDYTLISLNETFLKNALNARRNVLLFGKHGTSKTTQMVNVLNEMCGGRWLYLSASTLDPWTDLIGVPRPITNTDGSVELSFIRPSRMNSDLEVIVIDEINRAPKKVLNAIFELIQFKSINGVVFKNLKAVWACANPDNDENETYTVDKLDTALIDRFHIIVRVSEMPSESYFAKKYGKDVANNAMIWYRNLPSEVYISPRRLDYAIESYINGGIAMTFTLPATSNPKGLQTSILSKNFITAIEEGSKISDILRNNIYAIQYLDAIINGSESFKDKYLKYITYCSQELLISTFSQHENVIKIIGDIDRMVLYKCIQRIKNGYDAVQSDEILDYWYPIVKLAHENCLPAVVLIYDAVYMKKENSIEKLATFMRK